MKVAAIAVASFFAIGVLGLGAVAPVSDDFGDHSYEELVSGVLAHPSFAFFPARGAMWSAASSMRGSSGFC